MKVAIVQDWLTEMGGAEKVLVSILNLFPAADVFTLTSNRHVIDKLPIRGRLNESFISSLPWGRLQYRNYLQLFPKAIESFDLSGYDLIVSSSYSVAKGVITNSNQLHICYCHSPVRYAWDLYHQYLKESKLDRFSIKGLYARHILHKLRIWDIISANRVDYFIANSEYIKKRIEKVYRRDSKVIFPPVDLSRFQMEDSKSDYYFTASRLVPYKKIDLIVRSFAKMPDKKLLVAGTGPDLKKIKAICPKNVLLLGFVEDTRMVELMQQAKAFVFAADEDFGIVPVEAQACGTPVICLGKGGTAETIIDGKTGIHFNEQTEEAVINAILRFESSEKDFIPALIRENAERFSEERFNEEFMAFVNSKLNEFKKFMKGIILAGGSGTRLHPVTLATSKQLLPVYDKPMIYYPLSVLMLAGIKEILVITTPEDQAGFKRLLADGSQFGIKLSYVVQPSPDGLAQAFILGEEFIGNDDVCLVLGDNIFYGHGFTDLLKSAVATVSNDRKAAVFGYYVNDPERYGVCTFDDNGNVTTIEEKPVDPKSNYAVVGLYFYPNSVVQTAKTIKPSHRGELEITTVNQCYLDSGELKVELMGRGFAWLDTGTHESLMEAGHFVETLEKRIGLKVSCPEEIAFLNGWISKTQLIEIGNKLSKNQYGQYLLTLANRYK